MKTYRYKDLDYVIRYPQSIQKDQKYPVVIYLHGAGGRGRDISLIEDHCFFSLSEPYLGNAISVAPQCYADSWFNIFEQLQEFIEFVIADENADPSRIYLLGASMGGYATWQMAMSRPELFAAIVPICGGGMYWNTGRLLNMGVWAFHGDTDTTVYPEESKKMISGIEIWGGKDAKLTIYKDTAHDAWSPTFVNSEMWSWLMEHKNSYKATVNNYDDVVKFG